jgi:flagellar hook-associated protein FlgK
MTSTFGSLNIPLTALRSMQQAMEVTSHNVANSATPGYSRQKVALVAGDPYSVPTTNRYACAGQIGTGVTVERILRFRSDFVDSQIRAETLLTSGWQVQRDVLSQIEVTLNEPSDQGIGTALGDFWSAWNALARAPDDSATRAYVVETAATLSSSLREAYGQLSDLQADLDTRVQSQVKQINDLAHRIADLNTSIRQVVAVGQQPNDLRDERGRLLEELSGLINVDVFESESGTVGVSLGGRLLVMDDVVSELRAEADPTNPGAGTATFFQRVVWADTGSPVQVGGISLAGRLPDEARGRLGGELGGTLVARDVLVTERLGQLDAIASTLITQVNRLHQTGFDLYGAAGAGVTATPVAGTVDGFTIVPPQGNNPGLSDGSYFLEIRDADNALEFRLVDSAGTPVAISSTLDGLGDLTADWQVLPVPAGRTYDTGRGIAIAFHSPLVDHSVSGMTPDVNVTGFTTGAVTAGNTEVGAGEYFVEVDTEDRFRLVDSAGIPVEIASTADGTGALTAGWQTIPPGGGLFSTGRGLTVQFSAGPYAWSERDAPGPLPFPSASATYAPREVQLGTRGAGAATVTLGNFFTGSGARTIAVSDYVSGDLNHIAAAAAASTIPGDGAVALAIARLQDRSLLNSGTTTVDEFYRQSVAQLGQEARHAGVMTDNHTLLLNSLKTSQEALADVSLDEEATHLIQYQRTYQAAARVMTAVDEMLSQLMTMGLVGR